MNHQCTTDWFLMDLLGDFVGAVGRVRFVLKVGSFFPPVLPFFFSQNFRRRTSVIRCVFARSCMVYALEHACLLELFAFIKMLIGCCNCCCSSDRNTVGA